MAEDGGQIYRCQLITEFAQCLVHGLDGIDLIQFYAHVTGTGFAHIHQIVHQLFQPQTLPIQHLQIGIVVFLGVGLFHQIHIVNDGGQRCFDVVGDVGDQFGFHPFGFHLLLCRQLGGINQRVQILGKVLEMAVEMLGVQLIGQFTLRHAAGTLQQCAKAPCAVANEGDVRKHGQEKDHHPEKLTEAIGRRAKQESKERNDDHTEGGQQPLPDDGQQPHHGTAATVEILQSPPHPAQERCYVLQCTSADGVIPPVAVFQLCLRGKSEKETDDQQGTDENAASKNQHTKGDIVPDSVVAAAEIVQKLHQQQKNEGNSADSGQRVNVKGKLIQTGRQNQTIRSVTCRAEQIYHCNGENQKTSQQTGNEGVSVRMQDAHQRVFRAENRTVLQIDLYKIFGAGVIVENIGDLIRLTLFGPECFGMFRGVHHILSFHQLQRRVTGGSPGGCFQSGVRFCDGDCGENGLLRKFRFRQGSGGGNAVRNYLEFHDGEGFLHADFGGRIFGGHGERNGGNRLRHAVAVLIGHNGVIGGNDMLADVAV